MAEYDTIGNLVAHYDAGGSVDEPLAMSQSGALSFFQADGLGSITSLTDATGAIASTYEFDAFGNLTNSTGSVANSYRYTAREYDQETGLYYYRARYYEAHLGRFITEDPLDFAGDDVNFYRYVYNNTTVLIDPSGLGARGAAVGAAIGGVAGGVLGGIAGGTGGAAGGGAVGSLVGPEGTIIGGVVGGKAGAIEGAATGTAIGIGGGAAVGSLLEDGIDWLRDRIKTKERAKPVPLPDTETDRCRKAKEACMESCLGELGKGGRCNQGIPYRNCIHRCLKAAGCEGYGDFW